MADTMNDLRISQCSALLTSVIGQMNGTVETPVMANPEQVVSTATTLLKSGYDPLMGAVSQVWANTIFAVRPADKGYLRSLEMTLSRYGNATRKLSPIAQNPEDNAEFDSSIAYNFSTQTSPNSGSVDQWKVVKQYVQQTNFYGTATYAKTWTVWRDDMDTAFHNAEELARFNEMNLVQRYNDWERFREAVAVTMQANFIAALLKENQNGRVIHALTEYNTLTGEQFTAQDIYKPANFRSFAQWLNGRIATLRDFMRLQSTLYQTTISNKTVVRHTPENKLRIAMLSSFAHELNNMAFANTHSTDYLSPVKYEAIPYWQAIDVPDSIAVTPVYTSTTGTVTKADAAVEQAGIIALVHDVDALGYCVTNSWQATTPINIRGGYWNTCNHAFIKTVQDQTEKAAVIILD